MTDDIATIRDDLLPRVRDLLLPRIATQGTIVCVAAEARNRELTEALDTLRSPGEDCWCAVRNVDDPEWHTPKCLSVRAVLAAGPETRPV